MVTKKKKGFLSLWVKIASSEYGFTSSVLMFGNFASYSCFSA